MKRRRKNPRNGLTTLIVVAAVGGAGYLAWRALNNPASISVPPIFGSGVGVGGGSSNSRVYQGVGGDYGKIGGQGY